MDKILSKTHRFRYPYIGLSVVDQCVHVLFNKYVLHEQDTSSYHVYATSGATNSADSSPNSARLCPD